ncbi:MAG TPA: peptidoglycan-binding domain-containing protein [Streptosporangiaceae bacterium]|nr:peptidoglycan-binding domain-containing protein [Streptosporangiaceae bacterium]
MARYLTRRVTVIAAAVAVVAGGAVAGVAAAASGGRGTPAAGGGRVTTVTVVRTDLVNTVQVGGSIGYGGSYTIAAPSGTGPSVISQDQHTVTQDQQALSAAEQAGSDTSAADNQTITADQANVSTAQSTLSADQAKENKDCAGTGASSQACSQDQQQVSQDQAALAQASQQLAAAQTTAKTDRDQDQATIAADQTKLAADQATLSSDQATAVNPGTTYTWLPQPGQVIRQDQAVYSVSDQPVPLLYGSVPAYRAFYGGMSDGGDVGELTHDLITLGYGDGLVQSDHYSKATAAAVARWQQALGLPVTGQILLGEVIFEPGPIRVTTVTSSAGTSVGGGPSGNGAGGGTVLTATDTAPIVTIDLDVTQEYLVKPGDAVSVVLPDGTTTVAGRVQSVGSVATCPGGSGTGTGSGGGGGQSPCASGGSNSGPAVPVTITLDSVPSGTALAEAPVNVNITSQRADNVLAVPVNSLLALVGGGFGVDVVTASGAVRLTAVTTGLYSSTLVQVSGHGITAGMRVEVPSS